MLLSNKQNKNCVINSELVASYRKNKRNEKHTEPYLIVFTFSGGTENDMPIDVWSFRTEQDRDFVWTNIMRSLNVMQF